MSQETDLITYMIRKTPGCYNFFFVIIKKFFEFQDYSDYAVYLI